MFKKQDLIVVFLVVVFCAASRLVKHPYNFTPIVALSVFTGSYIRNKWWAVLLIGAMVLSDYFIGFYDWRLMFFVYFSIALSYFIAVIINKRQILKTMLMASTLASISFFVITNFSVWVLTGWYSKDWQGLANCYILALPFFKNSFLGDIIYSLVFFSCYKLTIVFIQYSRYLRRREIIPF